MITDHHLILASKSPRRQYLLREAGLTFEVRSKDTDESFSSRLQAEQIPLYLAQKKAEAFKDELKDHELLVTADTIVWLEDRVLNKPSDAAEAFRMLRSLSATYHEVFTACALTTTKKNKLFYVRSRVFFRPLSDELIRKYIAVCQPFDKAGAYGAQETLPAGMKPCSPEEVKFLGRIGRTHLNVIETYPEKKSESFVLVDRIEGSYFNVMGLPLQELYAELSAF
jgi:septum formation protein